MTDLSPKTVSVVPPIAPKRWYEGLALYQQQGIAHVLATVVVVNGSAPRALQAKMIVTSATCCDTLGGGGLEHDVITTARQLLKGEAESDESVSAKISNEGRSEKAKAVRRESVYTKHYPLGAKLAQCCGGSVTVMFECFNVKPPLSILVFGAGHVAKALMTILAELPCQVDWVDSRSEMFEPYVPDDAQSISEQTPYQLPAHIRVHISDEPTDFVRPFIAPLSHQASYRFILVMTHDHSLDFDLVRAALDASSVSYQDSLSIQSSDDSRLSFKPYIGCISSATKANRFKERLLQRGYDEQAINNLTMPIGIATGGKEPMAVAVSIAAQIMQHYYDNAH